MHGRKHLVYDCYHSYIRPCVPIYLPGGAPSCGSPSEFSLAGFQSQIPNFPNARNTTHEKGNDFQGWAIFFSDGGTRVSEGETSAGLGAVACSLDGMLYVMFGPVITTEAHLAYVGTRLHSNNTAEHSSIIEAVSFLVPNGPVARESQTCIFYDSRHAASICLGTVQSRANVTLELTSKRLLLQVQLRLRFSFQHIYSHAQNPGTNVQTMLPCSVHLV